MEVITALTAIRATAAMVDMIILDITTQVMAMDRDMLTTVVRMFSLTFAGRALVMNEVVQETSWGEITFCHFPHLARQALHHGLSERVENGPPSAGTGVLAAGIQSSILSSSLWGMFTWLMLSHGPPERVKIWKAIAVGWSILHPLWWSVGGGGSIHLEDASA